MKTLVTYFTQTGNTRKVAEEIFGEIHGDKEIKPMDEVEDLDGYDLVFAGFPIMAFGPAAPARKFLEQHSAGKNIALFITHAALEETAEKEGWLENCKEPVAEAELVGFFHCQGELAQNVIEALLKSDVEQMREFGEQGPSTRGQPDEGRLEKAREFAREVLEKFEQ